MADELEELKKASAGLLYPSETDTPFDVFCWSGSGSAKDQVATHAGKGRKVEEVEVWDFFGELEGADDAEAFQRLREVLESQLTGLKIFRVGSVRIDVYLIGQTHSGSWAGLHTVSVET